ncbi:hypothetical protein MF621_004151 (plasmid) [Bacillus velezensis]|uniref:hypothetical protein n=1 Tax=Bacillus velezensis TaxID=492670 RepID=UPI002024F0D5|nr:hypothetical protein [Bacillus velezensis]URJ76444.1 hypothetical protein MF619_004017 [Bacillus velezensis]URJ80400.1 hypothetical protein MF621_004151 [Bacillus velezensis]
MATSFQNIYEKFLGLIDDYELGLITQEERNEVLFGYLNEARSLHFPQCEKDLNKITVEKGVGEFHEDLTPQEEYILAHGMKMAWISTKLNNADNMSKEIGDRDYKAIQGTSYIKELSKLLKDTKDEIRELAVDYTYKSFSLEEW